MTSIRHEVRPGDAESVARLHGELYREEFGWDASFEDYVLGPFNEFACRQSPNEKIWLVEAEGKVRGCIAIVQTAAETAQLRWFLLHPSLRGQGLGRSLLEEALDFAQSAGYASILLWTVKGLDAAANLYRAAGFHLTQERDGAGWGKPVTEQRYDLDLRNRLRIGFAAQDDIEPLTDLLQDAVEDGASVGFTLPFSRQLGREYWTGRIGNPGYVVLAAWLGVHLVGSVQLAYPHQENGRCRAEVQRLLVHRSARRRGIGSKLVARLEAIAKNDGRRVLFLNTRTGDPPEAMYEKLGYTSIGVIPDFAMNPDGTLNDTTFMYKRLPLTNP